MSLLKDLRDTCKEMLDDRISVPILRERLLLIGDKFQDAIEEQERLEKENSRLKKENARLENELDKTWLHYRGALFRRMPKSKKKAGRTVYCPRCKISTVPMYRERKPPGAYLSYEHMPTVTEYLPYKCQTKGCGWQSEFTCSPDTMTRVFDGLAAEYKVEVAEE